MAIPRPAEFVGVFLRYCRSWQRILQASIVIVGALILVVHGPAIAGLSGYVWLSCITWAYLLTEMRDPALYKRPLPVSGVVDTRHAFSLVPAATGLVLRVSALVSLLVWAIGEDLLYVAGRTGLALLFLALSEHVPDLMGAEAVRLYIVLTGREAELLATLWQRGVQQSPQPAAGGWPWPYRREFILSQGTGEATTTTRDNGEILLDE